jgi:hypothetical protein
MLARLAALTARLRTDAWLITGATGATLENTLRVAGALGVGDLLATALDPYRTDVGKLRADEALPTRVRHRRAP